ncbi:heavy metal transporter [Streptomyces sp. RKND-216]|nr:heavy metal transporter [Streptomyces sp. RKND-216]
MRVLAACLVLAAVAGYLVTQHLTSGSGPARCTVTSAGGSGDGATYRMHPEQAANAATIEAVASSRGLPERAVTIALATAMQESGLRNIDHGDRDSVGLFQQRPSQGWGSVPQIMDPVYAAGKFYEHLVEVPGYSRLPLTVAAQKVQRSGFPQAYAKHEGKASLLTGALTGRHAASLTCTMGPGGPDERPGDANRVREKLAREFGPEVLGEESVAAGTGTGGGRSAPGSTAADGAQSDGAQSDGARAGDARREVVLPASASERGWELAHWAVAQAGELRIAEIAYDGRAWSAERAEEGWRPVEGGAGAPDARAAAVTLRVSPGTT